MSAGVTALRSLRRAPAQLGTGYVRRRRETVPALLVAGVVFFFGAAGFRIVPDSQLHAATLPFGMVTLVALSAAGAGALVFMLLDLGCSRRLLLLWAIPAGFWLLFPGVDALGLAVFTAGFYRRELRYVAPLVHPVVGFAVAGLELARRKGALPAAITLGTLGGGIAAMAFVAAFDGGASALQTTPRYLLPALIVGLLPRGLKERELLR